MDPISWPDSVGPVVASRCSRAAGHQRIRIGTRVEHNRHKFAIEIARVYQVPEEMV